MPELTLPQMRKLRQAGLLHSINDHRHDFIDPIRASKMDFTREISAIFMGHEISGRYNPNDQARPDFLSRLVSDAAGTPREPPHPTLEDVKEAALLKALNAHYATLSGHQHMEIQSVLLDGPE